MVLHNNNTRSGGLKIMFKKTKKIHNTYYRIYWNVDKITFWKIGLFLGIVAFFICVVL